MTAAVDNLIGVLRLTTSFNSAEIRSAEKTLTDYSRQPGYGDALRQITENQDHVDPGTRLAAAIALKNFIKKNWNPDSELAIAKVDAEERTQIRNGVLAAMLRSTDPIRRQLCESVCLIGDRDFPNEWPELIQVLAEQLDPEQLDRTFVSMSCIEQLTSRYRRLQQSKEVITEMIHVIQSCANQLTALHQRLVSIVVDDVARARLSNEEETRVFEVLLLGTKCYLSMVAKDLPAFYEDHLAEWMECFMALLRLKADSHNHDNEPTQLDEVKREECEIFVVFAQRYEEEFGPYIMRAIENVWQLLTEVDHRMRFDSLVGVALGFLSAICERPRYSSIFRGPGVLEAICQNVIIKNMILRREDLEQFQDEPFDYLKRDVEGADSETRRRGATNFVRSLTKHFEAEVFGLLATSITTNLETYAQNPAQEWLRKDVVYLLVSALTSKTSTERYGATSTSQLINISDFFTQYVRTDLYNVDFASYPPILVADALNFVVLFRNYLQPEVLVHLFAGADTPMLRILSSDLTVLHHYAGFVFDKFCTTERENISLFNSANLPVEDYANAFCRSLQLDGWNKSVFLITGLLRALSLLDPTTAANPAQYVEFLTQMVERAARESQPQQFVELVFRCLQELIANTKTFARIYSTVLSHVVPIIEMIDNAEVVDLQPYARRLRLLIQKMTQ